VRNKQSSPVGEAFGERAGASLLFAFLSGTEEIPPSRRNTDPAKLRQRWPPSARGVLFSCTKPYGNKKQADARFLFER